MINLLRRPFNYRMSISSFNDVVKSMNDADNLSSWRPFAISALLQTLLLQGYSSMYGICQQKLQAGLDIHEGRIAQKYIDEIVRPHVNLHIDNHTLADSTVFMRGGAKPHTARISQDCSCSRPTSCCQPRILILVSLRTYCRLCPET